MNADVLTTRVADGIAVITLGSAKRIYFDDGDGRRAHRGVGRIRGRPQRSRCHRDWRRTRLFQSSFYISLRLSKSQNPCALPVASGPTTPPTMADSSTKPWRCARACQSRSSPLFPAQP